MRQIDNKPKNDGKIKKKDLTYLQCFEHQC